MKSILVSAALLLAFSSCKTMSLASRYTRAIEDAMYPDSQKIDYNLIPLDRSASASTGTRWKTINGQEYVLMVTWTSYPFPPADSSYNNGTYSLWVTAAPQLQRAVRWSGVKNQGLRVQQLLGMPPTTPNTSFVELWIRPSDLFRPCPDPEVTDRNCTLCFSATDSEKTAHVQWITAKRLANYTCDGLYDHYPWTDLGYTYDWNAGNKTHRGLSEFVLKPNSTVYVQRTVSTAAYLAEN